MNFLKKKMNNLEIANPLKEIGRLNPSSLLLCGPGPGNAHPRVHAAMTLPQVGHMDADFINICEDVKKLLRYVWQTKNTFTIPISGTGSAAWEAAVANLTQPNDIHLVCVNGYFGERHCDIASRYKADVRRIEKPWGEVFSLEEIKAGILEHKPNMLWVCYAETSTGALQPLEGISQICKEKNCLFLLDSVTAIGGIPLFIDQMGVDVCYAASQKCLSCPPGISPITFGEKAIQKIKMIHQNGEKTPNWYLDMSMIQKYLIPTEGVSRIYHHTAPISMMYAFREALTLIAEEGIENVWKRHECTAKLFWKLIEEEGLEMHIKNENKRLHSLHTVKVPHGIDAAQAIRYIRQKYKIEIGGGLGEQLAGKVFRVGLMGYNSRDDVALLVVSALKDALKQQGWKN